MCNSVDGLDAKIGKANSTRRNLATKVDIVIGLRHKKPYHFESVKKLAQDFYAAIKQSRMTGGIE